MVRLGLTVLLGTCILSTVSVVAEGGASSPVSGGRRDGVQPVRAGWEDPFDGLTEDEIAGRVYRTVRETIYAPTARPTATASPHPSAPPATIDPPSPPTPHITTTLGPVFKYFIHHPLRSVAKVAPSLARFTWATTKFLASSISTATLFCLSLAYHLVTVPMHFFMGPVYAFVRIIVALRAIWLTVLGAVVSGCGIGAMAGVITAGQARSAFERWSGRAKPVDGGRGFGGGKQRTRTQVERMDPKGKGRAMDGIGRDSAPYFPLDRAERPENWDRDRTPRKADWKRSISPLGEEDDEEDSENYFDDEYGIPRSRSGGSKSSSAKSSSNSSAGTVTRHGQAGRSFRRD